MPRRDAAWMLPDEVPPAEPLDGPPRCAPVLGEIAVALAGFLALAAAAGELLALAGAG